MRTEETNNRNEMAALFCAMVAAQKNSRALEEYFRVLPLRPRVALMALSCRRKATE